MLLMTESDSRLRSPVSAAIGVPRPLPSCSGPCVGRRMSLSCRLAAAFADRQAMLELFP